MWEILAYWYYDLLPPIQPLYPKPSHSTGGTNWPINDGHVSNLNLYILKYIHWKQTRYHIGYCCVSKKLTISNFAESTTRPEKVSSPWTPSVVSSLSCWLPSLMRNLMESLRNLMKMDQVSCQLIFIVLNGDATMVDKLIPHNYHLLFSRDIKE